MNYTYNDAVLAVGTNFADALAGTGYAVKNASPIILLNNNTVDTEINNFLSSEKKYIKWITILGGQGILPDSLIEEYLGPEPITPAQKEDPWIFMN